ncbi:MAG TPA: cytochrome c [Burkholderiales bacterium]|nr:cytochrome c [Burkholderiales bacterium]
MKIRFIAASVALSLGFAADANAQAKPEVLVKQRQAAMTLIGKYFGPLGGMAQGRVPYNQQVVQRNAAILDVLKDTPWDGFHESTKGVKSATLPALWDKPAEVKQGIERFQSEVGKLAQVSKSGDEAAVKAQIGAVGKTCGGCHDNFREKR